MITIAPATDSQRAEIRNHWTRVLVPRRGSMQEPTIICGRAKVSRYVLLTMAKMWVNECTNRTDGADLAAATMHIDDDDELVGFISWDVHADEMTKALVTTIHMVYVLGPDQPEGARRLGIGTKLLEHALDGAERFETSCSTPAGDGLLEAYTAARAKAAA